MQQPSQDEQRNLILAAVLSFVVIVVWQVFVMGPRIEAQRAADEAAQLTAPATPANPANPANPGEATLEGGGAFGATALDRKTALAQSERIEIETPRLTGSIALNGGRIDELRLRGYRETLEPGSPDVELLWPARTENAYFAVFGWAPVGGVLTPRERTDWRLAPGSAPRLTPETPVTLLWDNGAGLRFTRTIAVDRNYLFTVTQAVENTTSSDVRLTPIGQIERHGRPTLEGSG